MRPGACLLALALSFCAAPAGAAERLGRFFFTPEQRGSLDVARAKRVRTSVGTEEGVAVAAEKPPPPPQPEHVTYDGIVRRSDGRVTVWLNDRAVQDKDLRAGAPIAGRIRPDGAVTVQSAQTGRSVELKVGQSAELLSGSVEEAYARRAPPAPKPEAKPEEKPTPKPVADPATAPKPAASSADERDREDRMDAALRALEAAAAAAGAKPAPAAPVVVYPPPAK
jgi:hypothetical protein